MDFTAVEYLLLKYMSYQKKMTSLQKSLGQRSLLGKGDWGVFLKEGDFRRGLKELS